MSETTMTQIFDVHKTGERYEVPAGTIMLGYRGSIAHNMYVPNTDPDSIDDVDLMGIVLAPVECYLGLREWGSRGTREYVQGRYDCVYYDIKKFVSLLLQGNPNVVGMLWLQGQHYIEIADPGKRLIENRGIFVGKHVYNAFAGYAHAQLEKMETRDPAELRQYVAITAELKARGAHPNHKGEIIPYPEGHDVGHGEGKDAAAHGTDVLLQKLTSFQKKGENIGYMGDKRKRLVLKHGYDSKNAAHCIRLLRMCIEFLRTGEMRVYRTEDADELLAIKRGQWGLDRVKEHARDLFEAAKLERDKSPLPPEPRRDEADRLLIEILRDHVSARGAK